jgi:hypothetical protein
MTGKIAITVLSLLYFGAGLQADVAPAAEAGPASDSVQTFGGPIRTGQHPPEAAPPPPQGKTQNGPDRKEKPAAAPKEDPLKSFEPSEKVKADQAIDFPADI